MPKRATARDVAEKAGVSRTTVSFVLNDVAGIRISDETRRAVLRAAADLGYYPDATARRMVSRRTNVLGFVLRQLPDQVYADHFVPTVLNGFAQAAAEQGYKVLLETIPPGDGAASFASLLRERHVDGIALSGPRSDDSDLLRLQAEGAPVVLLGQLPGSSLSFVDVDNRGGAARATQHLLELGHRRIGFITNADTVYTASAERLAGFRQAVEEAGLPFEPANVRYGHFTPQSGGEAMADLLAQVHDLTAVFIASDTVALGALHALRRAGRSVPSDMAVVGFDDVPMAEYLDPPLTTVRLPAFGLGWGAGELLTRRLSGEEVRHPQLLLETELIVRESSGAERPVAPEDKLAGQPGEGR